MSTVDLFRVSIVMMYGGGNMKKLVIFAIAIVIVTTILVSIGFFIDSLFGQSVAEIITTATIVTTAVVIVLQLYRSERLKEAEFIVNFNTNFITNPIFMEVIGHCEKSLGEIDSDSIIKTIDKTKVIIYLDYLEPLYFLLKNGAIRRDKLYMLIQYRLFVVVCNPDVQNIILGLRPSLDSIVDMCEILNLHRKKLSKKRGYYRPHWLKEKDLENFIAKYKYGKGKQNDSKKTKQA